MSNARFQMMHCINRIALYRQRFHNRQAMGWKIETGLSYAVSGLYFLFMACLYVFLACPTAMLPTLWLKSK